MKTNVSVILTRLITILAIIGIFVFFLSIRKNKQVGPDYTTSDSIALDKIAELRAEYQLTIDSLEKIKPKIEYRLKILRDRDTVVYKGNDSTCNKIIGRKDSIINELDSLNIIVNEEAENYSRQLYLCDKQNILEIKRFATYKSKMDSTVIMYQDSLTRVKERLYSKFFKRNHLWNRNEFRKYVMKK